MTIDVRAAVPGAVGDRMQHYGRVLDLQGASGGGLVNEDARDALSRKSAFCVASIAREMKGEINLSIM